MSQTPETSRDGTCGRDVAGLNPTHAQAATYGITQVWTSEGPNADPDVDVVLNLTPPAARFDMVKAAITAGKHDFTEKPPTDRRRRATSGRTT